MALDSSVVADAIKARIDAIDIAVAQDNSTALTAIADEILQAVSEQGYIPNTPQSSQIILDLIQGLIDEGSLSPTLIDKLVTNQELATEITNVNDRLDQEFESTNSNFEDLRLNLVRAQDQREQADVDILLTHAKLFASEQELIRRLKGDERLIDAVVTVDPDTGQIVNRAFQYADGRFSQAELLIDGVEARVSIAVDEIETNGNQISDLSSEIELLPGVIDQRATAIVTDAISALEPAVAFNFFDSTQGWLAVNGGITAGSNEISVTWGDIESPALSYIAEENPRLVIALTRSDTGTTWDGTVIFTFDDASELVLNNALDPVQEQNVPTSRSIDLSGNASYTGTVVKIRVILGTSVSDEFDIRSITVGKPQAIVQQIDDLEASVTEAYSQINANEAKIEDRVTFTYYNNNTVTLSNASTVVNGLDSIVELQATRTEINANNVITKANDAAVFIDGSQATITQITNSIQNDISGVQQDADQAYASATTALSEVDAANGNIRDAITTIGGVRVDAEDNSIQSVLLAYEQFKFGIGQAEVGVSVARAFDEITVISNEFGAFAEQQRGVNAATQTEIGRVESEVLDTISARTGYCSIDGQPSGDGTPSECEANGGIWVDDAPLAETIRAARVTTADGQEATVGQFGSTYVTENGELVAVGSMTTDVNGFVSGFINRNDGAQSDFDIIASNFRVGNVNAAGDYVATLYLDTVADQLTFRGNVVLGDGYKVTGVDDIKAQDGSYTEFRYRRSLTKPTTPTDLSPAGWFLAPPSGDDILWMIQAQKVADGSSFVAGSTWSEPTQLSGDNGESGQSIFKSIVFRRSNSDLSTTPPTGGNYSNPVPSGWSDGVPSGEEKLWQSTRVFTDDGLAPQQSGWTAPQDLTNTTDLQVQYSDVQDMSVAGDPSSNPTAWSATPLAETFLQAQRIKENGVWGSWQVFRVKGEKGDKGLPGTDGTDGTSVLVVYATDSSGSSQSLTEGSREFVQYVEYTGTQPTLPVSGTFVRFKGRDGSDGQSVWPIYADDASGVNQSFSETGKTWVTFYESVSQPALPVSGQTFVKYIGDDGQDGVDGQDGSIGAGFYGGVFTSTSTDQAVITSRFVSVVGRSPVSGDIFTQSTSGGEVLALQYDGSSWSNVALQVDGSIVATGTIAAPQLAADAIDGKTITGAVIQTSSGTVSRTVLADDGVYHIWSGTGAKTDANADFFIKKDGTGFISGKFFEGEIIETRYGSNSGATPLTATAVGHNSVGNTVEVSGTIGATASETGDLGGAARTLTATIKRGTTTVGTRSVTAYGEYESTFNTTIWRLPLTFTILDTAATNGVTYDYSVTATVDFGSPITQIDFKTFENKLG